jgi:hypothetical protein
MLATTIQAVLIEIKSGWFDGRAPAAPLERAPPGSKNRHQGVQAVPVCLTGR